MSGSISTMTACAMEVGESRQVGVVIFTRFTENFLVECSMCGWRKTFPTQASAEWVAFCHNRNFKKGSCK